MLTLVVLLLAATAVSVAIGASWSPLSGIGAADHPARATDKMSPAVAAQLQSDEAPSGTHADSIGKRLIDRARLLGALPSGRQVYAVPSADGKLCIVVALLAESCSDALTRARPITFAIAQIGPGVPPAVWGATTDDVVSVSFSIGAESVTVPVRDNFFAWEGLPAQFQSRISPVTVTFADGSTEIAQ